MIKRYLMLYLIIFGFLNYAVAQVKNKQEFHSIAVVIASYNNSSWYEKNLRSVINQDYPNFRIIYINDCSDDGTGYLVEKFLIDYKIDFTKINFDIDPRESIDETTRRFSAVVNQEPHFFVLINNIGRSKLLANLYRAIYSCRDNEIIVNVDGDDWLADGNVLRKIHKTYASGNVWLTHGSIREYPSGISNWCEPVPKDVVRKNKFRQFKCPSHLKTFYAWLFKKIDTNDLLYEGDFFSVTSDLAIMFPMIEMAGNKHKFISDKLYIYNKDNPISDNKAHKEYQVFIDKYIRRLSPYKKLGKNNQKRSVQPRGL